MKKMGNLICKHKILIFILSIILLFLSFIGMKLTKINYDILVYLPQDIETVEGQNILTNEFNMGAYTVVIADHMKPKDILKLEEKFKKVEGVNEVISAYDAIGTTIPLEILPSEISSKVQKDDSDLLFITFKDSTSSESTIQGVRELKKISNDTLKVSGMSAMVLDTMDLSEREILIYIVIAVILCTLVLEVSLDSYLVPILLLANIGFAIMFNLGSNIIFGEISYITKALVAVLQLGVTTDFSIFLYHSYESKKNNEKTKDEAMSKAIRDTFLSVTGSSLTTIAGFLVLCTMQLTLGTDLGLVMAKGVFLGVVCVLTLFPSLLLIFDPWIDKTKHKNILPTFKKMNEFIIHHHIPIFIIFLICLVPAYLGYSKVDIYYKIDQSLPKTLDSIVANKDLKDKFNIVSPEIILINKDMKSDEINEMVHKIEEIDGIDFVLSFSKLEELGISKDMLSEDILKILESDQYQMIFINSTYDVATNELNDQIGKVNKVLKKYDNNAILAGEGPLMKDLVTISNTDFNNVNNSSIFCILIIMFFVLRSISLPILLIMAIEFAIFLNMAVSYFGGVTLPFVASIVLGTIQLGATIDYAILMTTTYLSNRRNGLAKEKAMLTTMNHTVKSIFVSGLCFFAATFGVGAYSRLEMVGSLCTLISRGAIISMIVVIMVLPSILLIFDSLILKSTFSMKGEKKMKKNGKKALTMFLFLSVLSTNIPVQALTKNETVYTKLNHDGSIKNMIVNEHLLNTSKDENIEDISSLKDIFNVQSDRAFSQNNLNLTWKALGDDIFYQGKTDKELPINVKISYEMDGKNYQPSEMIGKSGKVKIILKYQNKDQHVVKVNGKEETLYTPFVVTTALTLNGKNNSNVEVTNGKVVNQGNNYIILGVSTPGLYESLHLDSIQNLDEITLTFDTTKFELSSIYSVITPKVIENSDLEVFEKLDSVSDDVNKLQSSMNKIETGSKTLKDGIYSAYQGSDMIKNRVSESIESLKQDNTPVLNEEVLAGIKESAIEQVSLSEEQLSVIAAQASQGATLSEEQLNEIASKTLSSIGTISLTEEQKTMIITNADKAIDEIYADQIKSAARSQVDALLYGITSKLSFSQEQIKALSGNQIEDEVAMIIATNLNNVIFSNLDSSKEQIYGMSENAAIQSAKQIAENSALEAAKVTANQTASILAPEVAKAAAMAVAPEVAGETAKVIASETAKTVAGELAPQVAIKVAESVKSGVAGQILPSMIMLNDGLSELTDGLSKLDDGANELTTGLSTFNREGIMKISSLGNEAKDMSQKIEALVNLGESYQTFTMKSDNTDGSTKFIFVTDSLKVKEEVKRVTTEEKKESLWTRIKNLFH